MFNVSLQRYHTLITTSLFAGIVFSVLAYMYFLSLSVVHVVMRKDVMQEMSSIRSVIAVLEADYIAAHHVVSARVAQLDGYTSVTEKVFLSSNPTPTLVVRTVE